MKRGCQNISEWIIMVLLCAIVSITITLIFAPTNHGEIKYEEVSFNDEIKFKNQVFQDYIYGDE